MLDPKMKVKSDHSDMGRDKYIADRVEYCRLFLFKNGFIDKFENKMIEKRVKDWLDHHGCAVKSVNETVTLDLLNLKKPFTLELVSEFDETE